MSIGVFFFFFYFLYLHRKSIGDHQMLISSILKLKDSIPKLQATDSKFTFYVILGLFSRKSDLLHLDLHKIFISFVEVIQRETIHLKR